MVIADRRTSTCIHRAVLAALVSAITAFPAADAIAQGPETPPTEAPVETAPDAGAPDTGTSGELPATEDTAPTEEPAAEEEEAPIAEEEVYEETPAGPAPGTGLYGVVRDAATGETLIEAPVIVIGGRRVFTDYDGNYSLDLDPGTYTIRSYYDYYEAVRIENVHVGRGERTHLDIELVPESGMEADEVIIEVRAETGSEASELRERRESIAVRDGVSAEEIRRSPDGDAGEAARRIVGATVVNGEYLFVRGLGGRYTSVLLNGTYLPSSDPDQPGVQLDLFPSAILNSLTVNKTFTPDMPGDSTGGTMLIETREYPAHFTLGLTLTLGANTESTFTTVAMGPGGALDSIGYDDGSRALPSGVSDRLLVTAPPDYTDEMRLADARSFRPTFSLLDSLVGPNGGVGLNFGDTALIGDRRFGYYVALSYSNASQVYRDERVGGVRLSYDEETGLPNGVVENPGILRPTVFRNAVQWGGLGSFELELSDNDELHLTLLWSQNADSYSAFGDYYDAEIDQRVRASRLQWVERSLYFAQLRGVHNALPFGLRMRWSLSGSYSARNEPDTRDLTRRSDVDNEFFVWADNIPGSGRRLFMGLQSYEIDGNVDFDLPIETATVRFGGALRANDRVFSFRRFSYRRVERPENPDFVASAPHELFDPVNIGPNVDLTEDTTRNDGYRASQSLAAAYLMLDWPIWSWLRTVGGARLEAFRQTLNPGTPIGENTDDSSSVFRTDLDVLGSAGLIFTLTPDMFVRASYGTTVARPQIRELAQFVFPDFVRDRTLIGRADLGRTRIDNVDLRWEYYFSPTELVAVSGFFKNFENPIEMITYGNRTFSYRNVEGGINAGAEIEGRFSFGRFHDALRFFDLAANVSLVYSEVRLTPEQAASSTSRSRPLAGQSPYVVNVSLGFTHPDSGLTLRVFYNVFGERLIEAGTMMLPDVYQQPFHSFDVSASLDLPANFSIRAVVENIFLDDYLLTQGTAVVQQYNAGLTGSLSLSWRPE